jgi:lipopolysaccharide-induced tumor necrosis factor-alpha factor
MLEDGRTLEKLLVKGNDRIAVCGCCGKESLPNRVYEFSTVTWMIGGGICLVGCWFGMCLVPLCYDSFQAATEYCRYCNKAIG